MSTADAVSGPLPETYQRAQLRRAAIASTVGTTIEWYDFLLYGQVASIVFAKLFFPKSAPLVGTLEAFGVYFVGFVARPIGAAIFGHYGDRIGRKAALIATLLLTGLSIFAVGLVPTYDRCCALFRALGSAANGVARCCSRWSGRGPTSTAASSPLCRNSAARPGCSWPTLRYWYLAQFPAPSFIPGAGVYRFT